MADWPVSPRMHRSVSRKRPWLAALLAALATGLGHLYLRRWRRAVGWLVVLLVATVLFVEPATVDALAAGGSVDPLAVAPILLVGSGSVVDAYLLAHVHNRVAHPTRASAEGLAECPNCGREVEADLEFCHWCTAEFDDVDAASPGDSSDRTGN